MVGGGATHDRQNPITVALRVGQPFEQQHYATFAGHEAVGLDVERMAGSGAREHARRRPGSGPPRFQLHVDAAGQGEVSFAVVQAAAGLVDGEQARGAGGVHGDRRTVDTECVGHPSGHHGRVGTGVSVWPFEGVGIGVHEFVVAMRRAHEHAGGFGNRVP